MMMKKKIIAGLVFAGVLGISGAAFAGVNDKAELDKMPKFASQTQTQKLPAKIQQGERPPMPPKSGDRKPPEFKGKMPPKSGDKRPPMPPKGMSGDKRPPMPKSK